MSHFTNVINEDLDFDTIALIMRHSNVFASNFSDHKISLSMLRSRLKRLGFDLIPEDQQRATKQLKHDVERLDLVRSCTMVAEKGTEDCSNKFKHVPTNQGICNSLNPSNVDEVLNINLESNYWKAMTSYFNMKSNNLRKNNPNGLRGRTVMTLDLNER